MLPFLLALVAPLSCQVIKADQISGRDLAAAVPAFSALPPAVQFGFAPVPGQQRVFSISELRRIALQNHLQAEFAAPVCFTWELAVPDKERMASTMRKTLETRSPHVEILETSMAAVPDGDFVFPLNGLGAGSDKPVIWRGYVNYAGNRKFPIWARVIVTVKEQHVITTADLRPGDLIDTAHLKAEVYEGPIQREKWLTDPEQAKDMMVRRPVASGSALLEDMIEAPREVQRGDVVSAVVQNGSARLEVQAVAEGGGRRGQIITVRNPRSGRSFHARVTEKGTVVVVPGGQFGLVGEENKS